MRVAPDRLPDFDSNLSRKGASISGVTPKAMKLAHTEKPCNPAGLFKSAVPVTRRRSSKSGCPSLLIRIDDFKKPLLKS